MSDLQWCTTCDKAIQAYSNSLYCSEECLRQDAINHHPMLGYDFAELKDFPRRSSLSPSMVSLSPALSATSTLSTVSPTLSPLPSTFALHRPSITSPPQHKHQYPFMPSTPPSNHQMNNDDAITAVSISNGPSSLSDDILHLEEPTFNNNCKFLSSSNATLVGGTTPRHQQLFFV